MFGWFFKKKDKKMENDNNKVPISNELSKEVLSKVVIARQFEIFVEELDEEGGPGKSPIWRPVKSDPKLGGMGGNPIITVTSQADLQEKMLFYKQIGQRFRIIREVNPPSQDAIKKAAIEQGLIKMTEPVATPNDSTNNLNKPLPAPANNIDANTNQADIKCLRKNPKIITIGDMQIKYDGDKVYQKQWMKLTPAEAANFRIVSDSNNKIVSMNGKHIEAKRWTLVENATSETDVTEDLINA